MTPTAISLFAALYVFLLTVTAQVQRGRAPGGNRIKIQTQVYLISKRGLLPLDKIDLYWECP